MVRWFGPLAVSLTSLGAFVSRPARAASTSGQQVAAGSMPGAFKIPPFCHGLECPPFTVEEKFGDGIELRDYPAGTWVNIDLSDLSYDKAMRTGFMALFRYIAGANEGKTKVDMTAPVRTTLKPGPGPLCQEFTVSFFLPYKYQGPGGAKVPVPTEKGVYVSTLPATKVFVGSYGGWANETKVLEKAKSIVEQVEKAGKSHNTTVYYAAGYDAPFRLINRHNEVWVPA